MTYVIGFIAFLLIVGLVALILVSPYHFPYFKHTFDVSGKRKVKIEDLIDEFLINNGFHYIEEHRNYIDAWKRNCEGKIEKSVLKKYRQKQYERCLDYAKTFQFYTSRQQTRYKQVNYIKTAYKVEQIDGRYFFDFDYLRVRNEQLKNIGYETTLNKYQSKKQRSLMSDELREQIKKRDNYTCKICGKYMPDEVGLQIDHIIPIVKGGKSVPSNLQVLCSKCNGHKHDK